MSGRQYPIVLFPRFTTFAGAGTYTSLPIDVSAFESIRLYVWRGVLVGTVPTFAIGLEGSSDRDVWAPIGGNPGDPGPFVEAQFLRLLRYQFIRAKVITTSASAGDVAATCYAYGFLEKRQK